VLITIALVACSDSLAPGGVESPEAVSAEAVSMNTIAVSWDAVGGDAVGGYRLQRRANLGGAFQTIAEGLLAQPYFDTDLDPDTYYGYRVLTLTKLGDISAPSVVAGARTPPLPGILVRTHTLGSGIDADGYTAVVRRAPDSLLASIGPSDERRFSPLDPGRYTVVLHGLAGNCAVAGASADTVDVTDQGLQTLALVAYNVDCRDPQRGRISVTVAVGGDSLDANGFAVELTGIADSTALPDSLRVAAGGGVMLPASTSCSWTTSRRSAPSPAPSSGTRMWTRLATCRCITTSPARAARRIRATGRSSYAIAGRPILCRRAKRWRSTSPSISRRSPRRRWPARRASCATARACCASTAPKPPPSGYRPSTARRRDC